MNTLRAMRITIKVGENKKSDIFRKILIIHQCYVIIYMVCVCRIEETAAEREQRIKKWNEFLESEETTSK